MPKLIVFTGLLGIEKSRQASNLAKIFNWRLLSIDKLRKIMIAKPQYTKQEMYQVMINTAETWLKLKKNVILDATFSRDKYHSLLTKLINETKPEVYIINCTCCEKTSLKRLEKRITKNSIIAEDTTPERYFEHKKNSN